MNLEHTKSIKNHDRALMTKDVLKDGIHTQAYFHKDLKKIK